MLVTLSAHKNRLEYIHIGVVFLPFYRHAYLPLQGVQAIVEVPVYVAYVPTGQS